MYMVIGIFFVPVLHLKMIRN